MNNDRLTLDFFIITLLVAVGVPVFLFLGFTQGRQMIADIKSPRSFEAVAEKMDPAALLSTPAAVQKGKKIYKTSCVTCHGEDGGGKGPAGAALNPPPRNFLDAGEKWINGTGPKEIYLSITGGVPGTGMAGFGGAFSFEDRWALVHYLSTFGGLQGRYQAPDAAAAERIVGELGK